MDVPPWAACGVVVYSLCLEVEDTGSIPGDEDTFSFVKKTHDVIPV